MSVWGCCCCRCRRRLLLAAVIRIQRACPLLHGAMVCSARWRRAAAGISWHHGCVAADCGWRRLAGAVLRSVGLQSCRCCHCCCRPSLLSGWGRLHGCELRGAPCHASRAQPVHRISAGVWRRLAGLTPALAGSGMAWGIYFYAYNRAKQRYLRMQQRSSSGGSRGALGGAASAAQPQHPRLGAGKHLLSAAEAGAVVSRLPSATCPSPLLSPARLLRSALLRLCHLIATSLGARAGCRSIALGAWLGRHPCS